jgi:hypothetical protein
MPSPKAKHYALYIYSNHDDLRGKLEALRDHYGLTFRNLTRRMFEEVHAQPRLEEAIRSEFLQNGSDPIDGNRPRTIRIAHDEETLALASALAFRICGSGSVSEVSRLIVRYYAAHASADGSLVSSQQIKSKKNAAGGSTPNPAVPFLSPPPKQTRNRPGDPESKKTKYVATSYNLDVESVDLLTAMVPRLHLKPLALVSQLIEQYIADDLRYKVLTNSDVLVEAPPLSEDIVVKRFNFTDEVRAQLSYLCKKVLFSKNKSAMIRILIKVEAELQELRGKNRRRRRSGRGRARKLATSSR